MRTWWIEDLDSINIHGRYPYAQYNLTTPASIFIDLTKDRSESELDIKSRLLTRLLRALDDEDIMNANVLCPFDCTEFSFRAPTAGWNVMIQNYMLDIVLPTFSS